MIVDRETPQQIKKNAQGGDNVKIYRRLKMIIYPINTRTILSLNCQTF